MCVLSRGRGGIVGFGMAGKCGHLKEYDRPLGVMQIAMERGTLLEATGEGRHCRSRSRGTLISAIP